MKNKKTICGFSYDKNIANFEAFCQDKNFSQNLSLISEECRAQCRVILKCLTSVHTTYTHTEMQMVGCKLFLIIRSCKMLQTTKNAKISFREDASICQKGIETQKAKEKTFLLFFLFVVQVTTIKQQMHVTGSSH